MSENGYREKIVQDALLRYAEVVAKVPEEDTIGHFLVSLKKGESGRPKKFGISPGKDEFKAGHWVRLKKRDGVRGLKFAGVYGIYEGGSLVYIGSSNTVGLRLCQQFFYDKHFKWEDSVN